MFYVTLNLWTVALSEYDSFPVSLFIPFSNLLNTENLGVMMTRVDGELARLAEGLVAAGELAFVGLVPCVHVQVVLQVLTQGELLPAEVADKLSARVVCPLVSSKTVFV